MLLVRTLVASVILAMLPGCGPPKDASSPTSGEGETSGATSSTPSTDTKGDDASKTAEPATSADPGATSGDAAKPGADTAAAKGGAEAAPTDAAVLARDFLKSGGRRIGYSASKKGFAYPLEQRTERGFGLDVQFVGEDGAARDRMRVCQIGECEEGLDEIVKELMPKLAARLESEGYVAIRGIGWPQGRDDLEVSTLAMKLKYTKGRFEALREGKPAAAIKQVGGKKISTDTLLAIFIVPDSKLLGVLAPPSADAKGLVQEFFVFKLP